MASNLSDKEIVEFLSDPNTFLQNPDNARRALGLSSGNIASIRGRLLASGISEAQVGSMLDKVATIKEVVKEVIKVIGKGFNDGRFRVLQSDASVIPNVVIKPIQE